MTGNHDPASQSERPSTDDKLGDSSVSAANNAETLDAPKEEGPQPAPPDLVAPAPAIPPVAPSERTPAPLPAKYGRYEVIRQLGRGTFGTVFLAYDTQLSRQVAVKVPHIHLTSAKTEKNFLNEAKQLAQLRHPGIVTVFDVGVEHGHCFIVSEYVEGSTLSAWLKKHRPTWQETAQIVAELGRALTHAHSMRIVHRDLKPGNVILANDRRPVIVDFGLALSEIRGFSDQRGVVAGTPSFMSPEQVRGEGHRIDGRTDIYALGVIIYLMLTGRLPFHAATHKELFQQIEHDEPQPPRQLVPHLPKELEQICLKAMAKRINQRYTTAGDVADDLEALLRPGTQEISTSSYEPPKKPDAEKSPAIEPGSDPGSSQSSIRRREAERRRLTIVQFACDVYNSVEVAESLDHEEQLEVLADFQKLVRTVSQEQGGTFVQTTTDGALICFGYPVAFEDAAVRAVRTGLKLIESLTGLNEKLKQRKRAGITANAAIHSDLAIVEEKPADGAAFTILGHVRYVAGQLSSIAEPNTVVLSRESHRLVRQKYAAESIGEHRLKGAAGALEVFRVTGEVPTGTVPSEAAGATPLIGRDQEIRLLKDRWELAADGTGQVVLLTGDAGMGKSRLVQELKDHALQSGAGGPNPVIEWRCVPHSQNSSLFPAVECLNRLLGFERGIAVQERLVKLTAHLKDLGLDESEDASLFAGLLSLPNALSAMTPEVRKEKTLRLIAEWLRALADRSPLLFIVEDLHWADPTTLEFLEPFIARAEGDHILTVLSTRPDFDPPWGSSSQQTQIPLIRLTKRQVGDMIQARLGSVVLPRSVIDEVTTRTDGVPLFVEEYTRMILDRGVKTDPDSSGSFRTHEVPATLQDLLMARLDRMASNIEVVQLASAIGREFSYELMKAVWPQDEPTLRTELAKLVTAELLFERGRSPRTQFTFKHALIQDAAYNSLLKKKRQQFHSRIALALESQFPDVMEAQPELLAYHFAEADSAAKAVEYLELAGERALLRSAHKEAIGHLTHGLKLLQQLPTAAIHDVRQVNMRIRLGVPLQALRGYSAPEVQQNYTQAYELAQRSGQSAQVFPVLYGVLRSTMLRADYARAEELGRKLIDLANETGDPGFIAAAHRALGAPLVLQGKFAEAFIPLQRVLAVAPTPVLRAEAYRSDVVDPWITSGSYLSWVHWMMGKPAEAVAESERTIRIAEGLGHPFSLALALGFSLWLHQFRRDPAACRSVAERMQAISQQYGFAFWGGWRGSLSGWATAMTGDPSTGAAEIRTCIESWRTQGPKLGCHYFYGLLAEACFEAGNLDETDRALDQAQEFSDATGETLWLAEILRMRGELALRRNQDASDWFLKAIDRAKSQQAIALELRASLSLAKVWRSFGKDAEARELVEGVVGRFPAPLDEYDAKKVKEFDH